MQMSGVEKSHHRNSDQQWPPPPIAILVVAWTQAQVVNSNSTSTRKETPLSLKIEMCFHEKMGKVLDIYIISMNA